MRILSLLSILLSFLNSFAQYDAGTVIYSETNLNSIHKNYKTVDFDGDNLVDILFIKDGFVNILTWYKGDKNGNFSQQDVLLVVENNSLENEIHFADMNGDGIDDIVFQNSNTSFTTLLNDGQGNITEQLENEVLTDEFVGVDLKELVDIDNDGDIDGIFFAKLDNDEYLWGNIDMHYGYGIIGYNNGNGTLTNFTKLENEKEVFILVKSGDVDGDGDVDIICSGNKRIMLNGGEGSLSYENPFIRLYENLGADGIADKVDIDLPALNNTETDLMQIKLQDLNNDGTVELLTEHAFKDECDYHLFDCVYSYQFQVLDFNVQNKEFVVLETYDSWLHSYTLQRGFYSYNELYEEAFLIQFGHQNEDDNLDILSVNVPQGKLLWYLGDGKGGFEADQSQTIPTSNEYCTNKSALQIADVDNDGDLDVFALLNTDTTSTLTLFKNETPVNTGNHNVLGKMGITPNPIQGNSYIQLTSTLNQNLSKATFNLFTIDGLKLITGNIEDSRIFIPGVPEGIYLVEISIGGKNYINKLIVN